MPQVFAVEHRKNRVVIKVLPGQIKRAKAQKDAIKARLGVDVAFVATPRIVDTSCPSRHKCFGPLALGARMNEPSVYNPDNHFTQYNCAIHARGQKILTAGHCTHGNVNGVNRKGPWKGHQKYQNNYGKIGDRVSTRYTSKNWDLALIKLEDWNANKTTRIFGDNDWPQVTMLDETGVLDNMSVCVSLNRQDKYWCGNVKHPNAKWKSSAANIWVWGAGMKFNGQNQTSLPGDSGGPVVQETCAPVVPGCLPARVPIGIVNSGTEVDDTSTNTDNGNDIHDDLYFAKVQWALNNSNGWPGKTIYKGPQGTG